MLPLANHVTSLLDLHPDVSTPMALPDRVYAVLKHRILTCTLKPSERMIEKEICAEMGISRTPLREAINRLALEGLVVLTPYRGFAVAPVTVNAFRELCEVRRIIEPDAARFAAERAAPEQVAILRDEAELRYTRGQPETYAGYLWANSRFHRALVRCTGNTLLETMITSALDRHQRPLYLGLDVGLDATAATTEHLQLVDAIERHDSVRARALMVDHVSRAEERIVAALGAAGYR